MIGIPMGTNCVPLLADLFLYSYENEFLDKLIKEGKRKLARKFNLLYRYIDDLISFNNKRFKVHIPPLTKFCPETPYGVKRSHAKNFQNRNCGFPTIKLL